MNGRRPSRPPTARQLDVLAAYVASGGSIPDAADLVGIRPSTAKRHLADLRAKSGLSTEQLIYLGRAEGWLAVPNLDALRHFPEPARPFPGRAATGAGIEQARESPSTC